MGHNPSTRSEKQLEKKEAEALRTPAERLAAIRSSCAPNCTVFVTKDDVRFLLDQFDQALAAVITAGAEYSRLTNLNASQSTMIVELQEKNAEFRDVYDQENRSVVLTVERVLALNNPAPVVTEVEEPALPETVYNALIAIDDPQVGAEFATGHLIDHGGEA